MNPTPEPLGKIIEQAMAANDLNNSQLATLTGFSEGSIRNLKKFGVDPKAPVPTIQLLVAASGILNLHPVRILQLAGHLPLTIHSTVGALGEYVGTRFEVLPTYLQNRLLGVLAELEQEAGLASFGEVVRRFIPEAEALGERRLTLADQAGWVIGRLTGITTESLLLKGIQRRLELLFPDETIALNQIAAVAQHPVAQALMAILLPRRDILPGLEKLYFLLFFDVDRFISEEHVHLLRSTWQLLIRAHSSKNRPA